ncbi:MAG TPA: DegQ family serine endoprotease [Gammaproteobacteria bacterium]
MRNTVVRRAAGLVAIALLVVVSPWAWSALPATVDDRELPSLAPMLERVTPAVVNIATQGRVLVRENPLLNDPFFRRFFNLPGMPRERRTQSLGSGVIVDAENGYIITNNHVIDKAEEIAVTLRDGRRFSAGLVGTDPATDVAVIRIRANGLTAVKLADSDALRVGDFVVAIGNPFGLGQTVTSGIVSALGRTGLGIEGYEDFIQTDASINVGNSGGALVNLRGELVGINTAILAPSGGNVGIGFAIPSNMARDVMAHLVSYGEVQRGLLGVKTEDLTPELSEAFDIHGARGAVVVEVHPGSPAAEAGVAAGDVITSLNGRSVNSASDVHNVLGLLRVGEEVVIGLLRNGQPKQIRARLRERSEILVDARTLSERLAGAVLSDIPDGSPLKGRVEGVFVGDVETGSFAWRYGLRRGDVIVAVNRQRVRNLEEMKAVVSTGGSSMILNIQRGNGSVFILIQ